MRSLVDAVFHRSNPAENPTYPLSAANLGELLGWGAKSLAGVNVTPKTAIGISAVWRSVNILGSGSAGLPLHVFKDADPGKADGPRERVKVPLLEDPHPDLSAFELWELTFFHQLLWGDAALQKIYTKGGRLAELWPIPPERIRFGRSSDGHKIYEVTKDSGERLAYTDREILHLPGAGFDGICGVSIVTLARTSFGISIAADEAAARLYSNGSLHSGILTTDKKLEQGDADKLKQRWKDKVAGVERAHDIAVLDNGAKFLPVSMPPADAQFLESRKFQVAEVARWFGLPPHMLSDVERTTSWGQGIETQGMGMVVWTMRPGYLSRREQRISKQILRAPAERGGLGLAGHFAEYNVDGITRGDIKTRYGAYESAIRAGWMLRSEPRERENLPPVAGLEEPLPPFGVAPDAMPADTNPEVPPHEH